MNIIKTVGDLKKALSVYVDCLPIHVQFNHQILILNNDTQIVHASSESAGYNRLEIRLWSDDDTGA